MTESLKRQSPRSAGVAGTRNVSFKLPPTLVDRLDKMAVAEGRSRNASVRLKLDEIVRAHQAAQKKAPLKKAHASPQRKKGRA